jgi:hypothetical protein
VLYILCVVVALLGATIHRWRDKERRSRARTLEIYLVWWLAVAIGVNNIIGGILHIVDGPSIASQIGFTRGDGGFQFENAMSDVAIGTIAFLCIWFRGNFLLAAVIAITISWWGDEYGHIYQAVVRGNHHPLNTGLVIYSDFILPLVALVLYALFRLAGREQRGSGTATS